MKSTEVIQPSAMSAPIAHKGSKFDIPEAPTGTEQASVAEGFPDITMIAPIDGGLPPRGQDCNGMFYLSTDQKVFLQNGGILTFSQEVSDVIGGYPQGAILDYVGGNGSYTKVKSLIDDNTFNFISTPSYIDGEHWELVDFGGANLDLSNLSEVGLDKINQSKALETGNVSSDADVYTDVLQYAHSTFDKSKFEIVGSPVITDDGIASGFQPHNATRITLNDTFNFANKNFNFTFGGKLNGLPDQDLSANAPLLDIRDSVNNKWILVFQLKNGDIQISNSHHGGTSIYSQAITPDDLNGDFKADLIVNNENIILNFYQNGNKKTIQCAYPNKLENTKIRFAYGLENAFPGSYDLKKCSLTISGIPVFSGSVTSIDTIKPDDYTVVGTPTISADGIASGFSTSGKYLFKEFGEDIVLSDCEIICSVKFRQTGALQYFCTLVNDSNKATIAIRGENNAIAVNWQANDRTAIIPYTVIIKKLQPDVWYFIKCKKQGKIYSFAYSTDLKNWEVVTSIESEKLSSAITKIILGASGDFNNALAHGAIDLNSVQVNSNGNLIYQPCLKIPYTLSKTGSKIADVAYRDRVQDMYEQFGYAPYYTLDEENQNFTLPMGEIYGMIERDAKKDGNEIYTGTKTFIQPANSVPVILQHSNATVASPPETVSNIVQDFQDASGKRTGCLYNTINTDGSTSTSIQVIRGDVYNTLSLDIDTANKSILTHNGNLLRYVDFFFANEWGWCRKWSDGWLEQGGIIPDFGSYSSTVLTFLRPWKHTGYSIVATRGGYNSDSTRTDIGIISMSTANCNIGMAAGSGNGLGRWYACGWDSTAQ